MLGLIHTSADLATLRTALDAMGATHVKIIPAWWPHGVDGVLSLGRRVVIRTSWGDPSYAGGARAYPDATPLTTEIAPYLQRFPGATIEIGNEPSGHGLDVGRYAESFAQTATTIRQLWPRAIVLPPAHSPHAPDRVAWLQALRPTIARHCDGITIHGYTDAEAESELALVRQHVSTAMAVYLTEVNYGTLMPDAERALRLRSLIQRLPIGGALLYHLDTSPLPPLEQQGSIHYRLSMTTLTAFGKAGAGPPVEWVGMTRMHYNLGRTHPICSVVMHATAGRAPGDLTWLRQGGSTDNPVSAHYYISKAGQISQLVKDSDTAWHAGSSKWNIDGQPFVNLNPVSIGIELENANTGNDPYPAAQISAAVDLARWLVERYRVPRSQLVRHLDISPGRKTDPAGLDWGSFADRVYGSDPWAAWGSAYPLPIDQRGFAIPTRWRSEGNLGAAIGPEVALAPGRAARAFARGVIVWMGGDRTEVIR